MNAMTCSSFEAAEVSPDDFRQVMRTLVGGVSILTVGRGNDISGMTVTSVTSLSVEPATLIVSVNRSSSSWPLLERYRVFGVNIPAVDQLALVEIFAGKTGARGAARFREGEWDTGVTGAPLLRGAASTLDCEVEELIERHSHTIVVGRIRDARVNLNRSALAYWDGRYVAVDARTGTVDQAQALALAGSGLREF